MLRSTHDAVQRENYTLRDALREANAELFRHRKFIAGIKNGTIDVVQTIQNIQDARAAMLNAVNSSRQDPIRAKGV